MSEARRGTNLPVFEDGVVRFSSSSHFLSLYNKSLHRGAVAVYHDESLEPLKPFDVSLHVADDEAPVPAQVQVVSARPGMYLFQLLDPDTLQTLTDLAWKLKNHLADLLNTMLEVEIPEASPAPVEASTAAAAAAPAPSVETTEPEPRKAVGTPLDDLLADGSVPAPLPTPQEPKLVPEPMPVADEEIAPRGAVPAQAPMGNVAEIVGVDFGQSYTGAAVGIDDGVFMIPDQHGYRLFPTTVSYPETGRPLVSWDARQRVASHPNETIGSVKRLLGRSFSDPLIAGHLHGLPFRSKPGPNDSILLEINGHPYAIPQICAEILRQLREGMSERLGREVKKAVFTHPVGFTADQKATLGRAAQMAGFELAGLVEEPVAVALAYGYGQGKNEIVAVYDFGGGTFDFTILDISLDSHRVLVSEGDSWLGGDDFDLVLAQAVANQFWRDHEVELQTRAVEWQRLIHTCEHAKQKLSEHEEIEVVLREIVGGRDPIDLQQRLRRPGFELIAASLFEQSMDICQAALDKIGFEPRDITELVVSGGTARIPFVRDGLARFFEREITELVHPQQAVALGAGVEAARLCGHGARQAHSS